MPQIPVYEEKVGLDTGGTPTPQLSGLPSSASGANVAESLAGLGKEISGVADSAAHIVAYKQRLDSQQKVDDLAEQAASEWQDHLHGDGGLLTRQGDAAKGITAGSYEPGSTNPPQKEVGIKYQDSFDGLAPEIKNKYLSQTSSEYEKRLLNHRLDSYERVYRNSVIAHEGEQSRIARHVSSEASIDALKNTAADSVTVGDFQHVVDQGMDERERALRNEGHSDQDVINSVRMKTADEFAATAVQANLEKDPEAAQALFDGIKDKLSGRMAATLQDHLDGKMISIRADAINKQIAEDPNSRNPDGTFNLGYVEKTASDLASTRPVKERDHFILMAKQQAMMADSALRQQKQQATTGFQDAFAELRDKNVPYQQAEKIVLDKYGTVFSPSELDKLREQGVKIYQRDPEAIQNRLKVMNDDQKSGYQTAQDIIKSKYKLTTKALLEGEEFKETPGRIMLRQLDKIAPSMSGQQIKAWTTEQLKDVPTKPGYLNFLPGGPYFTGKTPAWQEQNKLESQYGTEKIAAARSDLIKTKGGKLPTYVELENKLSGR